MGKITNEDLQEALGEFAELLGLDYSPYSEELHGGTIKSELLPKVDDTLKTELTQETKEKPRDRWSIMEEYYLGFGYRSSRERKPQMEATILGKINAIAEYLGIDFEVQPEKVVTTPVEDKWNVISRLEERVKQLEDQKKGKK